VSLEWTDKAGGIAGGRAALRLAADVDPAQTGCDTSIVIGRASFGAGWCLERTDKVGGIAGGCSGRAALRLAADVDRAQTSCDTSTVIGRAPFRAGCLECTDKVGRIAGGWLRPCCALSYRRSRPYADTL